MKATCRMVRATRFMAAGCALAVFALAKFVVGANVDVYDTTGGVTDYRIEPGDVLTVHGDALTDDICVWLNGGELRIVGDVTIAAAITQDVASVIFLEGERNVKFTGALVLAGAAAGNDLVITGDVASANSTLTFSGTWDTATTKDSVYIKTGTTVFTNGTFTIGGCLFWEGTQVGNVIVDKDATLEISDRENAKPSSKWVPHFRPFSNGKVFEVRTGGIMRFGPYRQFLVGTGTLEYAGGAANGTGWNSRLRIAGGDILWYGQGTSRDDVNGTSTDGVILYGRRINVSDPAESLAAILEIAGGSFATGGAVNRYGSFTSWESYMKVIWSGGTWKPLRNYYGNMDFSLTKTAQNQKRFNMPCDITGDVTLDLSEVATGNGVNQLRQTSYETDPDNGRWTGCSTASLTVIGGNNLTRGFIRMSSFHPNGMALSLTRRARMIALELDRGEQRFRSMSIDANCYFQATNANVILTTVGATVPPADRLLAPQVDMVQDAEGTLGTVRLSLAYGQDTYAGTCFAPVAGGVLYLSDVPAEETLADYNLPAVFTSVQNRENLKTWTLYVNGAAVGGRSVACDATGQLKIVRKGLRIEFF